MLTRGGEPEATSFPTAGKTIRDALARRIKTESTDSTDADDLRDILRH